MKAGISRTQNHHGREHSSQQFFSSSCSSTSRDKLNNIWASTCIWGKAAGQTHNTVLYQLYYTQAKATVNWKRLQTKTRVMTALGPTRPEIPAGQVRKAKIAYSALFIFMLLAWSAILIGKIFKYVLWLIFFIIRLCVCTERKLL